MLAFNDYGYLTPAQPIEVSFEEFVCSFVINDYRAVLFNDFKEFLDALIMLDITSFYQWINGSFISQKPRPNDIDVVTFIDFHAYEQQENLLRTFTRKWNSLDLYFVKEYPLDHPKRFITVFDQTEWRHLFSTDRRRRAKGFLQIKY